MSTQTTAGRTTPIVPPGRWNVDPAHSSLGFAVRHMGIATIRGRFAEFDGTLDVAPALADTSARGEVIVASIDTNDDQRDAHLRSPDFFDVERYPDILFYSKRIEAIDEESSQIFGELTMHGVTREVKLEVVVSGVEEDPWGKMRVGLEGVGVINRSDFDMKFNQALGSGNMLIGNRVSISLDISAVREA
jgi:polyisoprenoid-binding protein YceI